MTTAISHGIIWKQENSCLWVGYRQLPATSKKGPQVGAVALYPDNLWHAIVGKSAEDWTVVGKAAQSSAAMAMVSSAVKKEVSDVAE